MFKDVGKEIKDIAKSYIAGKMILAALVALALLATGITLWQATGAVLAIIIDMIMLVCVYNVVRDKMMLLYAYGELVDCVMALKKHMLKNDHTVKAERNVDDECKKDVKQDMPTVNKSSYWFCTQCGTQNSPDANYCHMCGTRK